MEVVSVVCPEFLISFLVQGQNSKKKHGKTKENFGLFGCQRRSLFHNKVINYITRQHTYNEPLALRI